MSSIILNQIEISEKSRPYFIADIGANHDGDLNRALRLIELAKESGADAAKFQNFQADKIVNKKQFDSRKQVSHHANWEKSVYDVYKDASISLSWTEKLYRKCKSEGIEYLTTPYDNDSLDYVDKYLNFYKIGSGDITWIDFIENVAKRNKPIILSSGASTMQDVKRAVNAITKYHNQIVLLQCNTNYTADENNYNHINLNVLKEYKKTFPGLEYGLSDHTFGSETTLGAIALGGRVIEKHFTDDNSRIGPDHKFAMNPKTFKAMVESSKRLFKALGSENKVIEENEKESWVVQRRSLYINKHLEKGTMIKKEDLIPLRPIVEQGYQPFELKSVINKKLVRTLEAGDPIKREDLV